jgi:hypothetical protein
MMSETRKYTLGPDIDLDTEEVYEPDGTRLTEARARELAEQTLRVVRGRSSLTGPGQRSPRVSFRLPAEELRAAQELAEREGVRVSELARRALEEPIRRAS